MVWNITLAVGLLIAVLAAWLTWREHRWIKTAALGDGVVVELVEHRSSGKNRGTTYRPRVKFTTEDGSEHTFTSSQGSRPASYEVGEVVKVAYDRATSEGRIMSFGERFGFPVILAGLGLGACFTAVTFMIGKQLFTQIYLR